MYKFFLLFTVFTLASATLCAQGSLPADDIVGIYSVTHEGEDSRVQVTRQSDGTYQARTIWVRNSLDENGNKRLDEKNPDKSLRNVPCDSIVLFYGLKFNEGKQRWDGGKVYDPTRGIRANASCTFDKDGNLRLRGSLMGISQTVIWVREE